MFECGGNAALTTRSPTVGEASVRTVAHGFQPWENVILDICEPPLAARENFLSPAKAGSPDCAARKTPSSKAGGYGSHGGYAAGGVRKLLAAPTYSGGFCCCGVIASGDNGFAV
jgi:hypothetical protein